MRSEGFVRRQSGWLNYKLVHETPQLRVRSAAPLSGAPRALRAGRMPFIRVLSKIRGFGRILSAPTERVRTGFWAVPNRAGQGTNVLVQALCVIVRRHCRPGGFYPPLQSMRKAGSIQRTALLRNRAGRLLVYPRKNELCKFSMLLAFFLIY